MRLSRRSVLKLGLAAPALAALPQAFARVANAGRPDRALVLLKLDGGNDGLNTIVPFADDAYHRHRPGIGIPTAEVLRLDDHVGLNPALGGLRALWDEGELAVLQGIGYPHPDRSHFRSTDIWETATTRVPKRWSGWLGRALDTPAPAGGGIPGLQLDDGPLSLALVGERVVVPSVRDAGRFRVDGGAAARERLARLLLGPSEAGPLAHIQKAARQAYRTADSLERALSRERRADPYPDSELARHLWQIARLIEADFPARVFALRLPGFDTHSRQRPGHDALLRILGDAVGAFFRDLRRVRRGDRALLLTYSEFGRRVRENRSLGTDHGAAAPMLVAGGGVRGGIHGGHPSLEQLEQGDLVHHTDFRRVYASVLEGWLGIDATRVLDGAFAPLPFV